jgi:hypothetical protein
MGRPVGFVRDRTDRTKTWFSNWNQNRKLNAANNPQQKFNWGAFGAAILASFLIVGMLGYMFLGMGAASRLADMEHKLAGFDDTVTTAVNKAKAEVSSAKDKEIADAKAAADAAQKKSDELAAEKATALSDKDKIAADKAALEAELTKTRNELLNRPAVGTPVPVPAPAPNTPSAQPDVDRQLADRGYSAADGWTRNVDAAAWADIANNNPGDMVVGTSFARTSQEAADAAKNNPTVAGTYEQKANPNNWVLVYNKKCMTYDAMAYQLPDGSFAWGGGFTECGVGIWVNLASGGQFRLLCDNGVAKAPVVTNRPASLPEVVPNVKLTPPPVTTVVHNPPKEEKPPVKAPEKMKVCIKDSGDQTLVEINKSDFNPAIHSTNVEDCKKPVVVVECPEGQVPNTETETPGDCLEIKDPVNNPELPADHDPAPAPTEDQVTPDPDTQPLPNPIDPALPDEAPASPVVTAPDADPVPNPAPVPAPEQPAPTPEQPGQVFEDPDNAVVAAPAAAVVAPAPVPAAAPVVAAEAPAVVPAPAPVVPVVEAPAAAPTVPTDAPADVVTQVASVDASSVDSGAAAASVETSVG